MDPFKPKNEDLKEIQNKLHQLHKTADAYLDTDVTDLELSLDIETKEVIRGEVGDFKNQCFLLHHVLSRTQCQQLIARGEEMGFGQIEGVKESVRNMKRIMTRSQPLVEVLWERVKHMLEPITIDGDPHKYHIHGNKQLLQGVWTPSHLNPIFRLCRYNPGGHFAPHFDGYLVVSSKLRSMKTLMLYLSDDFEDGNTNFIDERQTLFQDSNGRYCAEEANIQHRVKPEMGMAIVFNHHRLHEGQAIRNGTKYILRTDIMYERTSGEEINQQEEKALIMGSGKCMEAMELYRKAFKLSPALEAEYGMCRPPKVLQLLVVSDGLVSAYSTDV